MADWIVTPTVEIIKCFVSPLKLHVGYFVQHNKKFGKLKTKVQNLSVLRSDLQLKVDASRRNLETVYQLVEDWFAQVDTEVTRYESLEALVNGQDLDQIKHFSRRYGVGKMIREKTKIIDSLIRQGRNISSVSPGPGSLHGVDFLPKDPDFESFPSRQSVTDEIMKALSNDEITLFGVYGMGGIGKTMLINQICSQVKDDRLFEVVVIVTISQNVELKKIQAKIADVLEFEAIKQIEDVTTRASVLSARLMREQSVLIVLDDLWTEDFNLHHVGIPYGQNKGCKVVVTTRILKNFCGSYKFQESFEVKTIKEDESWDLFMKNVGDVPDIDVARDIVKECNGLPIALVVLGRALRNKDTLVWEDTALQLKDSHIEEIEGMNSKVFCSIKLSYDFLKNDIEKKMFPALLPIPRRL